MLTPKLRVWNCMSHMNLMYRTIWVTDIVRPGILHFNTLTTSIEYVERYKNADNRISALEVSVNYMGDMQFKTRSLIGSIIYIFYLFH